jgi:hypothetical protein
MTRVATLARIERNEIRHRLFDYPAFSLALNPPSGTTGRRLK